MSLNMSSKDWGWRKFWDEKRSCGTQWLSAAQGNLGFAAQHLRDVKTSHFSHKFCRQSLLCFLIFWVLSSPCSKPQEHLDFYEKMPSNFVNTAIRLQSPQMWLTWFIKNSGWGNPQECKLSARKVKCWRTNKCLKSSSWNGKHLAQLVRGKTNTQE